MAWDLLVIGGGAAGYFGAIQAATLRPGLKVLILEKTPKLLSKVRISGGGRCNVTHSSKSPFEMARHYPRGAKTLKSLLKEFDASAVIAWFDTKGVKLKTEADGRMFPLTDRSETIIDCFMREADRLKIRVELNRKVTGIAKENRQFRIQTSEGQHFEASKILIAIGGHSNPDAYSWLADLGHTIEQPIPSLFTFNDRDKEFKDLMGISVSAAEVKIAGTKFVQCGPVLITHWGLSGPAIIKLSAWSADYLHQHNYRFDVLVSWVGTVTEEDMRAQLLDQKKDRAKQKVSTNPIFALPARLWQKLCERSEIEETKIWGELSQRHINKLVESVTRCHFHISGKTTFKEEFVTCGGVALSEINPETMESKHVEDLYFAGEVLNIDGETGGFNFQAAWTTAFIAARAAASGRIRGRV